MLYLLIALLSVEASFCIDETASKKMNYFYFDHSLKHFFIDLRGWHRNRALCIQVHFSVAYNGWGWAK